MSASLVLIATLPSLIVGTGAYLVMRVRARRQGRADAAAPRKVFLVRLGLPDPSGARAVRKR